MLGAATDYWFLLVIAAVFALFIAGAVYAARQERKRVTALGCLAMRLGLQFRAGRDFELAGRLRFLDRLARGSNRYCSNALHGTYRGHPVLACDYHYETHSTDSKGRRQTHHHHLNLTYVILPRHFPELQISPEGFFDRIAAAVGFDDIDFESAAFSRQFKVTSADRKFAYDFCHARMIEELMRHPDLALELEGNVLATVRSGRQNPDAVAGHLDDLLGFRERMPNYLFSPA